MIVIILNSFHCMLFMQNKFITSLQVLENQAWLDKLVEEGFIVLVLNSINRITTKPFTYHNAHYN